MKPDAEKSTATVRAARRPYDGAPPVIPHEDFAIDCTSCHRDGVYWSSDFSVAGPSRNRLLLNELGPLRLASYKDITESPMRTRLPLPRGWNRRTKSAIVHGHWDSYPVGTTFAGAGLSPAGTTGLYTAHVDQYT